MGVSVAQHLFCEGKPKSLDALLLNSLLLGRADVQIVPVGGKYGMRAFIEGRLSDYETPPSFIGFRDRDFDKEPPEDISLIRERESGKPIWLTHRACAESYLLDGALIHEYWHDSSLGPSWRHGPSRGKRNS